MALYYRAIAKLLHSTPLYCFKIGNCIVSKRLSLPLPLSEHYKGISELCLVLDRSALGWS